MRSNIHSYEGMCLLICVMYAAYACSAISLVKQGESRKSDSCTITISVVVAVVHS